MLNFLCFFVLFNAVKTGTKLEFVFYMKTDVSPYWSDAVLYRKSGFGTAKGYELRK